MTCARRGSDRMAVPVPWGLEATPQLLHPCTPLGSVSVLAWQERDMWEDICIPPGPCRPVDWKKHVCYMGSEFLHKEQSVVICICIGSCGVHVPVLRTHVPLYCPQHPCNKFSINVEHLVQHLKKASCSTGTSVQRAVCATSVLSNGQNKVPVVLYLVWNTYWILMQRLKWKAREIWGPWKVFIVA